NCQMSLSCQRARRGCFGVSEAVRESEGHSYWLQSRIRYRNACLRADVVHIRPGRCGCRGYHSGFTYEDAGMPILKNGRAAGYSTGSRSDQSVPKSKPCRIFEANAQASIARNHIRKLAHSVAAHTDEQGTAIGIEEADLALDLSRRPIH